MTLPYVHRVTRSVAFYPVTVLYVAATLVVAAVVGGAIRLDVGLLLLGLFAVLIILLSMRQEVAKVHHLVNSQHDVLVATVEAMSERIEQLIDTLESAEVEVPHDQAGVDRDRQHPR